METLYSSRWYSRILGQKTVLPQEVLYKGQLVLNDLRGQPVFTTSIWFIFTFLFLNKMSFGEFMKTKEMMDLEMWLYMKFYPIAKWMGSVMLYQFDLLQNTQERWDFFLFP